VTESVCLVPVFFPRKPPLFQAKKTFVLFMAVSYRTRLELLFSTQPHRFFYMLSFICSYLCIIFMGRVFLWPTSLSGLVVVFALTKQILWPLTKLVKMEMPGLWE